MTYKEGDKIIVVSNTTGSALVKVGEEYLVDADSGVSSYVDLLAGDIMDYPREIIATLNQKDVKLVKRDGHKVFAVGDKVKVTSTPPGGYPHVDYGGVYEVCGVQRDPWRAYISAPTAVMGYQAVDSDDLELIPDLVPLRADPEPPMGIPKRPGKSVEQYAIYGDPRNPKDILGSQKVPLHHVPAEVLMEIGLAMLEGSQKYGGHNYRKTPVKASVYYDSAMHHIMNWWEGGDEDPDPNCPLHELIKAMANLVILRDAMLNGTLVDDRPLRLPNGLDMDRLNDLTKTIKESTTKRTAPYTHKPIEGEKNV